MYRSIETKGFQGIPCLLARVVIFIKAIYALYGGKSVNKALK